MGFETRTPEQHSEISRMGGKAAHLAGRAHRFTSEEAKAAEKKRKSHGTAKRNLTIAANKKRLQEQREPLVTAMQQRMAELGLIEKS